jgi:mRNA-degrading endonuclease RelE of RelBE toxin-antitoxin system
MNWHVELATSAIKDLKRLPRDRQARMERAIDEMESDPMAGDVKPLKGPEWRGYYRKRIGSYRIIFTIHTQAATVEVSAIVIRSEKTYR